MDVKFDQSKFGQGRKGREREGRKGKDRWGDRQKEQRKAMVPFYHLFHHGKKGSCHSVVVA